MSAPLKHDMIINAATRLFRVCIRLYPRRFRVEYGADMEATFRRRMLRARSAGAAALLWALLSALHDVLAGAAGERFPARRRALISAGRGERLNETAHGSRWLDALWLDARFSLRMLLKHPGLTIVAGFAMAVAIAVGTTAFETISRMLDSQLPFPGGDRIVQLQFVQSTGGEEEQLIHEFAALRGKLATVEHLSAYRTALHNLVAAETAPEPVEVAEITPSAFSITSTAALHGRYLLPSDEADAAPPVVVVAYQAWQAHFARDPNIVGRTIRLGGVARTVVGVMPEGYAFPLGHQFWIPLRVKPTEYPLGGGPDGLELFGRLAPGVTIDQAHAEFAGLAQPMAAARGNDDVSLRPIVVPYTQLGDPTMVWILSVARLLTSALTVLVAINVAILVYARTVTRLGELAVRSALGASRRRILTQLFIEALALSLVGAAAGLWTAGYALDAIQTLQETGELLPYWITFGLSARAVVAAGGLAVLAALIIGVVPGFKATGASLIANLHELHGRSGSRLGITWTALIVAQVAVAVAVLPAAVFISARVIRGELVGTGFPAESIIAAVVAQGPDAPKADRNRLVAQQRQFLAKLEAEPGVTGVAFSSGMPGSAPIKLIRFQDGVRVQARAQHIPDVGITDALLPHTTRVSVDLFKTYGVQVLAGRGFTTADLGTTNVVVNRSFVEMYLQEPNPLGLMFRFDKPSAWQQSGWHQIVGVVSNFPGFPTDFWREGLPTIYHPVAVGDLSPVVLSARFAREVPPTFINRFRHIGAEVDPALQLTDVALLSDRFDDTRATMRTTAWVTALLTASVLLLSAAGIYALMSFTVAQRTREIGIRTALGAPPRRLIVSVCGRAAWQIAAGVVIGSVIAGGAFTAMGVGVLRAMPLLLIVAGIMAVVALLATLGPARRGVRTPAMEALRAEV
jgi:predicted permease